MFQPQADLIQCACVLAETVVRGPGGFQLPLHVAGALNFKSAWQRGLPANQLPCIAMFPILAALNERGVHLDLGPEQMLPLIPGGVPKGMQESEIEPKFQLAAHIAA